MRRSRKSASAIFPTIFTITRRRCCSSRCWKLRTARFSNLRLFLRQRRWQGDAATAAESLRSLQRHQPAFGHRGGEEDSRRRHPNSDRSERLHAGDAHLDPRLASGAAASELSRLSKNARRRPVRLHRHRLFRHAVRQRRRLRGIACLSAALLPTAWSPRADQGVPTCAEVGLPARGFVFCCFNQAFKFTPAVFDV